MMVVARGAAGRTDVGGQVLVVNECTMSSANGANFPRGSGLGRHARREIFSVGGGSRSDMDDPCVIQQSQDYIT
jgi:hypothetical protein